MRFDTAKTFKHVTALAGLGLLASGSPPAGAQSASLSLTPVTATAPAGQTVTFTVLLNGGGDIGVYDFNIFLGSPNLAFTPGGFTFNPAAGFTEFPGSVVTGSALEVSAGYPRTTSAGAQVNTPLGTFSVVYAGPVTTPTTTQITFGLPGSAGAGGSEVDRLTDNVNELTTVAGAALITTPPASAPEPAAGTALCLGGAGLGTLALRRRRRDAAAKGGAVNRLV